MNAAIDKQERARARWKLLQQALLKKRRSEDKTHSIHRFSGFDLIDDPEVVVLHHEKHGALYDSLCRNLTSVDEIVYSLAALMALDPSQTKFDLSLLLDDEGEDSTATVSSEKELESAIQKALLNRFPFVHCKLHDKNHLTITLSHNHPSEYRLHKYTFSSSTTTTNNNDPPLSIYTRERVHFQPKLAELVSHHDSVDNTGNVCLWDSEKTLCHVLDQYFPQDIDSILELGVGMAGLAAMSQCRKAKTIYLTDGHVDSVFNNAVHVHICRATGVLPDSCTIQCQPLLWSTEHKAEDLPHADHVLVSDCTHFQEYHAALFWTSINSCRRKIWLCQPERGDSLQNFLKLLAVVNNQTTLPPLVDVQELRLPEIERQHTGFLQNDPTYDANIHCPKIWVLTKLREATDADRAVAVEHVRGYDTNKRSR